MDATQVASIIVAGVAAAAAYASQRAAAKASTTNVSATTRVDMEKDAYERARKYDTDTITRQDAEIDELRAEITAVRLGNAALRDDNNKLRSDNEQLRFDNEDLRRRITKLEEELLPDSHEGHLNE